MTMPPAIPDALNKHLQLVQAKDLALFSPFFSNILKLSSLPGILLDKRAKEELWETVRSGETTSEDAAEVFLSAAHVSNVRGGTRGASRNTLVLWIRVLWKWHHSDEYRDLCRSHKIPQAIFDENHIKALLALAGYAASAQEVADAAAFAEAYNAAVEVVELSPLMVNTTSSPTPKRRRKVTLQKDTKPNLQSYRQAIEQIEQIDKLDQEPSQLQVL